MIQLKPSVIIAIVVVILFITLLAMVKIQDSRNDILSAKLHEMNTSVQIANDNVVKVQGQIQDLQQIQINQQQNRVEHTNTVVEVKEKIKVIEKSDNKDAEAILNNSFNNLTEKINAS